MRARAAWRMAAVLCLALAAPAAALDPRRAMDDYVHDSWELEQGLPQTSVMAILQTRDGYLWVGTHGGLARFDGVTFTRFLPDHHVHALLEDDDGRLWIGTWGDGIDVYHDGQFRSYRTVDGLIHNEVRCLRKGRDGSLWIGTNGGLARFKDGRFTGYGTAHGLPNPVVRTIQEGADGVLWVGTHGGGLSAFKDGRFTPHVQPALAADEVIRGSHVRTTGEVWLATERGLKRLDHWPRGGKAVGVRTYTTRDGMPGDDIVAVGEDRDGQIWAGTRHGVARFHDGRISRSNRPLSDLEVRTFFEDREGSLWIGTYNGGLNRLKDRSFESLAKAQGLSADNARSVYEDRRGVIWIGTHNAGVNRLENGRLQTLSRAQGLPSQRVWTVTEDAAGTLWMGTFGGGLVRYSQSGLKTITTRDGLPSDLVRALLPTRDGSLWVGTDVGLARVHAGRVQQRFGVAEGLLHAQILAIRESADGTLWIGTRLGLNRLRGSLLDVPAGGADLGMVLVLHEDTEGTLWAGTRARGLWRLRKGRWTAYTTAAGLPDDTVLQILEDQGHLWLGSPRGIFRVDRRELDDQGRRPRAGIFYDRADGMDSVECNGGFQPSTWRTRDGRLWFPTMKGVAVLDPRRSPINIVPPPVRIDSIRVNGRPVSLASPSVEPGSKRLEISYIGLSFTAPEKVRFRYKLEGFDEDWIEAGTRRTAYYTTLLPGRYRFRVAACNNSGYWSDSEGVIELRVEPWFYQTWWFYSSAALGFVLLVAGQNQLRLRRDRRRFAAILEERTRIARELHDTLAQGLAVVGLQLEGLAARLPTGAGDAAQRHLDNARQQVRTSLIEAKHSVWDLRSPRLEEWDLRGALETLTAEIAGAARLESSVRVEGRPRSLPDATKRHLLRVVQEALSNTLKHARASRVEVTLTYGTQDLRLTVADDGAGFDPAAVGSGRHYGLAGMRERARLMDAQLTVERRAEGGTEVGLTLPLRSNEEHRLWSLFRAIRKSLIIAP